MRKFLLFGLLITTFMLLTIGVSAQEATEVPQITWTCPEGFEGQTLSVYNWATYIGETTISDFEALCGVTVIYDVYESNEAMIARLRQGNPGYDVAFPSDYAVVIMAREGLIQPLNFDNIPNFATNIPDRWKNQSYDPENIYTVPYLLGSLGVAYNIEAVGEEITSWHQVFEYDGPVAWLGDIRSMFSVALSLLGYDPNSTNPDEIAEARDYLVEKSGNVVAVAADDGQALLARGEVDIAIEYNGDVYQIIADCECDDYAYSLPVEGAIADISTLVVLTDAPNPTLAEVFMDYILDPVVNAQIVNSVAYATVNQAANESGIIDEELLSNPAIYPSEEALQNLYFLSDVGDAEQFYNDAWDELLILIGG